MAQAIRASLLASAMLPLVSINGFGKVSLSKSVASRWQLLISTQRSKT